MTTTRSGWIGWWIVTGALLALVAGVVACGDRDEAVERPEDLLRRDGAEEQPPPPPFTATAGNRSSPGARGTPPASVPGERPSRLPSPTAAAATPGADPTPPRSLAPVDVLRRIHAAQQEFARIGYVDEDYDGTGEFGGLSELSGASGGRMGKPIRPPLVPRELGQLTSRGEGRLGDYLYRVWLPGRYGLGIGELWGGPGAGQFDPDLAEDRWLCYAWPAEGHGTTYFISHTGRILATEDARYSGSGNGPKAGAALIGGDVADVLAAPASDRVGLDGNTWRPAR